MIKTIKKVIKKIDIGTNIFLDSIHAIINIIKKGNNIKKYPK
jgi:hypothetical protein